MTDMSVNRPVSNPLFALATRLAERRANAHRRRRVRRLLDLDDAILDDIGVTRDEAAYAAGLPLSIDAITELRRISLARRRAERRGRW